MSIVNTNASLFSPASVQNPTIQIRMNFLHWDKNASFSAECLIQCLIPTSRHCVYECIWMYLCTYLCLLQNSLRLNLFYVSVIGFFSESQKHHFASIKIFFFNKKLACDRGILPLQDHFLTVLNWRVKFQK